MVEEETAGVAGAEGSLQPLLRLRRPFSSPEAEPGGAQQRAPEPAVEVTSIEKKEKPLPRLNIHSAFWILASIATTYYVEFFKTVKEVIQQESWWFVLGSCLLVISLSVAFYCIIYLEWYCRIEDYDASYPALIPITTASFIAAAICFNVSLWPVWSFLTPLVLFTQFMGIVMLVSLLG
ncbi:transmembrane protein 128 [Rhineura floridana]|uniref:transmembrane protein 128 n=1 Tax=Rhineura floridana TaxID=261503 RepID=UPI002AC875EA|nr:transmembrane protein 128 [Rhineura floridana]